MATKGPLRKSSTLVILIPRFMNGVEHALTVRVSIFKEIPETFVNVYGFEFVRVVHVEISVST